MIEISDIKYSKLIELGFERQNIDDQILFNETGYSGYNLSIEFEYLDVAISTSCKAGIGSWDFKLSKFSNGDIIRSVKIIELESLIDLFKIKNQEIEKRVLETEIFINTA